MIVLSRLTFHRSRNPPSSCLTWKQLISVSNLGLSITAIVIIPVGLELQNNVKHNFLDSCFGFRTHDKFMTWIEGFHIVIVVTHSSRRYHFPVLISTLTRLDAILMFFGCVKDYIDSIQVLRKVFPHKHPTNK